MVAKHFVFRESGINVNFPEKEVTKPVVMITMNVKGCNRY
jgi:hypothetical protein